MFYKPTYLLEEMYMIYISSHKPSNKTQLKQKKKEEISSLLQSPTELQMTNNFLLCSSPPWLLWRFQFTWIVTVLINAVKIVDSYHHSTSCFSFLTSFSHFIFSHFWLNSSEWSWADVAVGIVQGFLYKFLILCRLHIYKHQWLFFSLLSWSHRINTQDFAFQASRQAY